MKNLICILSVLVLVCSLSACRSYTPTPTTAPETKPATAPAAEPSTRPTVTSPSAETTVPNTVGEDGYVHPTDEYGNSSETTMPDIQEEISRIMPRR